MALHPLARASLFVARRPRNVGVTARRWGKRGEIASLVWGESVDPFRADRVYALDERLTRQFEKTLAMLIRLRELSGPSRSA